MASFTLECESDFLVLGMQEGESYNTAIRIVCTLIALTVISGWFSVEKIKKLSLFFAHWLSGMVLGMGYLIEGVMISACWTSSNLEGFINFIKFVELTASKMLAITNLAIAINLALIVMSHRTMSRVKSISSPLRMAMLLVLSVGISATSIPFGDKTLVLGTTFWVASLDEGTNEYMQISYFYLEFFVGTCMFLIVSWLLVFRMEEVKGCWKMHRRIRFYFGLTLIGTLVNLEVGVCGMINVLAGDVSPLIMIWSWIFRWVQIALDTVVLYGVLREKHIDERGDGERSSAGALSSRKPSPGPGGDEDRETTEWSNKGSPPGIGAS